MKILGDRFDYFVDVTMAYEDPMETCTLYEMSKVRNNPKEIESHCHFICQHESSSGMRTEDRPRAY